MGSNVNIFVTSKFTCTNVHEIVIYIFQGSVVTQTVLGGLTIYPPVVKFLQCILAKI